MLPGGSTPFEGCSYLWTQTDDRQLPAYPFGTAVRDHQVSDSSKSYVLLVLVTVDCSSH